MCELPVTFDCVMVAATLFLGLSYPTTVRNDRLLMLEIGCAVDMRFTAKASHISTACEH